MLCWITRQEPNAVLSLHLLHPYDELIRSPLFTHISLLQFIKMAVISTKEQKNRVCVYKCVRARTFVYELRGYALYDKCLQVQFGKSSQ